MFSSRYVSLTLPGLGLLLLIVAAYGAPVLAPYDPVEMNISDRLKAPSAEHWLGQDEFGRDIFSRLLFGARVSLSVAIIATSLSLFIGVTLGLIGGYFRGLAEFLTMRLVDIVLSFPPILLALLIVTLVGPGSVTLTACLALLFAPGFARITYGEVLATRGLDYVEAARALGAGPGRIVLGTVLPNITGPIAIQYSLTIASAILIESGLSFLGLGVVPPDPSWGLMIRGARSYMAYSAMGLIWPCMALIVTVLIFNALCDGLRDVLDPRTRISLLRPELLPAVAVAEQSVDLLEVEHLSTLIRTERGIITAVDDVSISLRRGETLAIVGESGSGKSMTGLSIMGLLPEPAGRIAGGHIRLRTRQHGLVDVAKVDEAVLESIRGDDVAMIFQEPMTALNPVYKIGDQIIEAILRHRDVSRAEAWKMAVASLERVGIPDPGRRVKSYPHELSGGMRQRAMIAMALALKPALIIADEPTTALDVTIQAQILELLKELRRDSDPPLAMIFITHNLGVVTEIADRIMVMYAGQIVEEGTIADIFSNPRHPYTRGLLESVPKPGSKQRLKAIPGTVPSPFDHTPGCAFAPRCPMMRSACNDRRPDLADAGQNRRSRCLYWQEMA